MKKIIGFIAALALMITLLPLQQAEAAAVNKHYTVNIAKLDIREKPSPKAKIVGSLKKGTSVFVYNTEPGGWSKIKYNNKAGYIATSGLNQNGSSSPSPSKSNDVNKHYTVNVDTTLNVREKPSPKAKVVGSLKNGAVVFVYNTEPGGWSKIKYNGKAGYVASGYLVNTNLFQEKYPQEKIIQEKILDLDKDGKNEKVILSQQGNLFLIKNNTVTKVAEGIISEEFFPAPKLTVFNPTKNEYQIITTYQYGPSNTKADVYRMQKGSLVKIFGVMGDQGIRISKSVIYQDWKKYRDKGGWDKVTAIYSWDNKKQKFIASGVKP